MTHNDNIYNQGPQYYNLAADPVSAIAQGAGDMFKSFGQMFGGDVRIKKMDIKEQAAADKAKLAQSILDDKHKDKRLPTPVILGIIGGSVVVIGIVVYAATR